MELRVTPSIGKDNRIMAISSPLKVVKDNDLDRIHEATVEILEKTGVMIQLPEARDIFKKHGARVDGDVVHISREMLQASIDAAPSSFTWWGRKPGQEILVGEGQTRTHVAGNNGPIHIQDLNGGRRPGTMEDLINLYKLAQVSDVCNVVGQIPVDPDEVSAGEKHLKVMEQLLRHSDKPLLGVVGSKAQIGGMFEMLEMTLPEKGYLADHPIMGVSVNPLSPLSFSDEACVSIIEYARRKQPVMILTCAMCGVTSPIKPMGTAVLQNAEMLAGLVLTQLVNPGTPYVYSPASAVPDMRTAAYITGSPESNLINIAGIQLARDLYNLPSRCMAGLTDAKAVDAQAGYETMQNFLMLMAAGVSMVNESLGVMDSIMTTSYEKFILDEEMINRAQVTAWGMDTSDEALSLDLIHEIGHSGSYLMHPSTLKHCREMWKPSVSYCGSYANWEKEGEEDVLVRANRKWKELLSVCPETLLDAETDKDLAKYVNDNTH